MTLPGFGSSTKPNSGTATTTHADDLLFGAGSTGIDEASWTPMLGYTIRQSNTRSGTEDQIANSTGGYSATFTIPTTAGWVSQIAAFKPATAGVQVSSRSDTLSNSQPSATSIHTFTFTVNSAVSGSSTLVLALPGQFTFNPGITLVQSRSIGSGPATSIASSFGSSNNAGNLIVVSSGWSGASITASISDTEGNTYATAVGPIAQGSKIGQIWYARNIKAGVNTVTVTFNGTPSGNMDLEIHEYSGADQTSPLDATSSQIGTATLLDSGSATTTLANELIFGYSGDVDPLTGTGFVLRQHIQGHESEDKIAPSGGLYNITFTNPYNAGSGWLSLMATFKPASSAGINCGDVDAATSVQFNFNYPSCAATATAWGFAADAAGSKITLQAPLVSTSNVFVATGTAITIKIGSNATVGQQGVHWITNPSTAGIYTIAVGGTFGGSGNTAVSINSAVSVQVAVAESLSFSVASVAAASCTADDGATVSAIDTSSISVPFGNLFPANTFFFGCQDLVVSTNAGGGYSLTVQEQTLLRTLGGFTIPQTSCDGGACTLTTAAAWATPTNNGFGHTCRNQTNHDCGATYSSGNNFRPTANVAAGDTPQVIMSSSTPASATGRIKYRVSAGSQQPAGDYKTVITFTITPTY